MNTINGGIQHKLVSANELQQELLELNGRKCVILRCQVGRSFFQDVSRAAIAGRTAHDDNPPADPGGVSNSMEVLHHHQLEVAAPPSTKQEPYRCPAT